jgi:hypothetical protein
MSYFLFPSINPNSINKQKRTQTQTQTHILCNYNNIVKEVIAFNIIKNINNYEKYYYIFDSINKITYNELEKNYYFLDQSNIIIKETNLILLVYKDTELYSMKEYLLSINNKNIHILIIEYYLYLLESIELLIENKLVHNNINDNTIYFCNNDYTTPLLLKFNYSIHIDKNMDLCNLLENYNPNNIYLPLEFHVLSYIHSNNLDSLSSNNIQTIIDQVYNNEKYSYLINDKNIIENYKEESKIYLNIFINKNRDYITRHILEYFHTWDNYKLSIFFIELLLLLPYSKNLHSLQKILTLNIHPCPYKRWSINDIRLKVNEI